MRKRIYASDKRRAEIALDRLLAAPKPDKCTATIDLSRARVTVCPPCGGGRYAAAAGHVGAFAAQGIGRYEPDTGPDTEGEGF